MEPPRHEPFVGRERELEALRAALVTAAAGHGRIVLLVGEPGIGKTRTADEFARLARASGAEVLVGRCYEGDGAPAFLPWITLLGAYAAARDTTTLRAELGAAAPDVAAVSPDLRERLPDLPGPPTVNPEQARFRFFDGITRALTIASAARPIVLLIDDLQGADQPSLLLVQFLARAIRHARLLVVAGLRDVALAPGHALAATLGELVREQVSERIPLAGLDETEVGRLLASFLGAEPAPAVAAMIRVRTGGNPLYVTEVARTLRARGDSMPERLDLPDTLRLAIGRRLAGVSSPCQALLRQAALFGREFRLEVLVRASGVPPGRALELCDEAVNARILNFASDDPSKGRFVHAVVGETLIHELGVAERVLLHRRAAESLAEDVRAVELASEIAHHWFQAGPTGEPSAAVEWACRAGARATALFAYEEAARLYRIARTALGWCVPRDDRRSAEVLLALGDAEKRAGNVAAAREAFVQASGIARDLESADVLTRAALGFAPVVVWAEQAAPDPDVVRQLEEAIDAWGGRESGTHACALARLGVTLYFGNQERKRWLFAAAVAMARRVGDRAALRYVLASQLAARAVPGSVADRLAVSGELVRLAEAERDLETLAWGRVAHCVHVIESGDVPAFDRELAMFQRLADELHQPLWSWSAHTLTAHRAILAGRLEDAEREADAALGIGRPILPFAAPGYAIIQKLAIRSAQGRPGDVLPAWRSLAEGHPSTNCWAPVAWLELQDGNGPEAHRIFERLSANDFETLDRDVSFPLTCALLAEVAAGLRLASPAATLYDVLVPFSGEWLTWVEATTTGPVAFQLGLLAQLLGRMADARRHLEEALAASWRADARPFIERTYAALLRIRGRPAGDAMPIAYSFRPATPTGGAGHGGRRCGQGEPDPASYVFRKEGDYWTIGYEGNVFRLRHVRGLQYLARLLRQPGCEIHVCDLLGQGDAEHQPNVDGLSVQRGLGAIGAAPDGQAQRQYRERLRDLDAEEAESQRLHDVGRLTRVRAERDALQGELLGAASRNRQGSSAERARVAVTKGIKVALTRIEESNPDLAAHLRTTIRRGYFCAYLPDPRRPICW